VEPRGVVHRFGAPQCARWRRPLHHGWHVFLVPHEGNSRFVKLHDRLCEGALPRKLRPDIPTSPDLGLASKRRASAVQRASRQARRHGHRYPRTGQAQLTISDYDAARVEDLALSRGSSDGHDKSRLEVPTLLDHRSAGAPARAARSGGVRSSISLLVRPFSPYPGWTREKPAGSPPPSGSPPHQYLTRTAARQVRGSRRVTAREPLCPDARKGDLACVLAGRPRRQSGDSRNSVHLPAGGSDPSAGASSFVLWRLGAARRRSCAPARQPEADGRLRKVR
jgi:hypothetical protein